MTEKKRRTKSRGNGTGSAYWSPKYRYWIAQAIVDWRVTAEDKPLVPVKRTKGGFKRKEDALAYCQTLKNGPQKTVLVPTLAVYWETFKAGKYEDLSASKQQAYRTAWKKLDSIQYTPIDKLTVADLQQLLQLGAALLPQGDGDLGVQHGEPGQGHRQNLDSPLHADAEAQHAAALLTDLPQLVFQALIGSQHRFRPLEVLLSRVGQAQRTDDRDQRHRHGFSLQHGAHHLRHPRRLRAGKAFRAEQ